MKTRFLIVSLIVLLIVSVYFNLKPDDVWFISFPDANTRPTYDTFHHISDAQLLSTGKGIKVGIIGKYFGYADNRDIYAGGKDFTGNKQDFEEIAEHGFWMATTLKEIAPDVEIYALGARENGRAEEARNITEAVEWAIENRLDILTYSAKAFREKDRTLIDSAIQRAGDHHIVTTFIHYDLNENILPAGFFPASPESYNRDADVNIYHFDYNVMLLPKYKRYIESGRDVGKQIGAHPYFSNSSMSPVLAGIVALMKEVNNGLPAGDYKKILIETSDTIKYKNYHVHRVVNAAEAVKYLLKNSVVPEKSRQKNSKSTVR